MEGRGEGATARSKKGYQRASSAYLGHRPAANAPSLHGPRPELHVGCSTRPDRLIGRRKSLVTQEMSLSESTAAIPERLPPGLDYSALGSRFESITQKRSIHIQPASGNTFSQFFRLRHLLPDSSTSALFERIPEKMRVHGESRSSVLEYRRHKL